MKNLLRRISRRLWQTASHWTPFAACLRAWGTKTTKYEPCIVAPISGGLGNQIWQYAVGAGAACFSGLPVYYDPAWRNGPVKDIKGEANRNFDLLRVFPDLPLKTASAEMAEFYWRWFLREPGYQCVYEEKFYTDPLPRYLGGFYANSGYLSALPPSFWGQFRFSDDLVQENEIKKQMLHAEGVPVAVHVRRGDFINSIFDVLTVSYYRRAMEWMREKLHPANPAFYVFSNGMDWAHENLTMPDVFFMDFNDNDAVANDFYLMANCSHHIIANSTLSWLAAWFCKNEDQIVVMPDRWFNDKLWRAPWWVNKKAFLYKSESAFSLDGWIMLSAAQ